MNTNFIYFDDQNIKHNGNLIASLKINNKNYILYESDEIKSDDDSRTFLIISEYQEIDNKVYLNEVNTVDLPIVKEKFNTLIANI